MDKAAWLIRGLCAWVVVTGCAANAAPGADSSGRGAIPGADASGVPMAGAGAPAAPSGTGAGSTANAGAGSGTEAAATPGSSADDATLPSDMVMAGVSGGAAGSSAEPQPDDTADAPGMGGPQCVQKASQVVLIGDSYINWASHTLPADLARESGQSWRNYAVGGFSMGSGGLGLIPPEWDQAIAADPDIRTVVMDGGGNDMLIPAATWMGGADCKNNANSPNLPVCQMIFQTALDAATALMTKMADHGVRDVVYFFYPHVPNGTLLGGTAPNAILDYALPKVKAFCDDAINMNGGKLRCHFVDLVPVFEGHADWFAPTDIHPNTQGSAAMAKAIWAKMKEDCVGQPESSGCCEP